MYVPICYLFFGIQLASIISLFLYVLIQKVFKLGAASPQAVKKLLALSETSKTRPKAMPSTPSPLSKGHGHAGGGVSGGGGSGNNSSTAAPTTSSSTTTHHQAHHHHSLTNSVDLTAESSSVTSLPSTRKTQTNNSGINYGGI